MANAGKQEEEGLDLSDDTEEEKKGDTAGLGSGGRDKNELDKNPNSDEESKGPYENLNKKYDRMKGNLIGN